MARFSRSLLAMQFIISEYTGRLHSVLKVSEKVSVSCPFIIIMWTL